MQPELAFMLYPAKQASKLLMRRCWNANSGDTGGLVDNTWLNIQWPKIDFLTMTPDKYSSSNVAPGGWGLAPWYFF